MFLDTTLRGGSSLNDETTGIALAGTGPMRTTRVDRNVIVDVGQGIDLFSDGSSFAGNVIERTPEFGLKMGHGASGNRFSDFHITASGIAAILIYGLPGQAATGNTFTGFAIDYPGALPILSTASYAIRLTTNGSDSRAPEAASNSGNTFAHIRISHMPPSGAPIWRAAIACSWPRAGATAGAAPNLFEDVPPDDARIDSSGGCLSDAARSKVSS